MRRYRWKKRLVYRSVLILVLLVVLVLSISYVGGAKLDTGPHIASSIEKVATSTGILPSNSGLNILIIGNNARDASNALSLGTAGGQADILIVAHIDTKDQTVSLISIPRDTLVAMPNWREPIPKIKSAFNLGLQISPKDGADMAMKYVSGLTGLTISNYVAIDFQGFVDAVNVVHGVKIDVPARLYDPLHSGANLYPGWQVLNGEEALAYVRIRQNAAGNSYRVNDFQRQQAELKVLDALKSKVLHSYSNPSELTQLIHILSNDVATNLNLGQIISLAGQSLSWKVNYVYLGSDKDAMDILDAPVSGLNSENYLAGAYYDVLDPQKVFSLLQPYGASAPDAVLPALPEPGSVSVEVYGSSAVAGRLKNAGFGSVYYRGPDSGVSRDTIIYPPGKLSWGLVIGRFSGAGNEVVQAGPAGLQDVIYLVAQ